MPGEGQAQDEPLHVVLAQEPGFFEAAAHGDVARLRALVEQGADVAMLIKDVPHHQQTAVPARILHVLERLVELLVVDAGRFRDLGRIAQSPRRGRKVTGQTERVRQREVHHAEV